MSSGRALRAGRNGCPATAHALLLALLCAQLGSAPVARAAPDKRPLPDYDGREQPTSADDVLIWIPRIALAPLWAVSELLVRRPLGFLISEAERAHAPEFLYDVFAFGPDHKAGLLPIAFVDFGFDPSVGLYAFWDDAFVKGQDLRLRASTWGDDWIAGRASDRLHFAHARELALEASAIRRPDYVFYGLGPRTLESDLSRYGADRLDAHGRLSLGLWRASSFALALGVRSVSFRRGGYDRDPTLEQQVAAGVLPEPDGYARGYTALYNQMQVAFDNRRKRPAPGTGIRIVADVEQESDVRSSPGSGFVRYGGTAGGFYDLTQNGRVVGLSLSASFADPLGPRPIPFTELVSVGGEDSMRGFVPGRLYGRSAAVATLRYRWPIWVFLDGSIQLAVGNVFGAHLGDFAPRLLRFSGAIGVQSVGSPDSAFELLLGVGSETFAHGAEITSVRIALGTNHGF